MRTSKKSPTLWTPATGLYAGLKYKKDWQKEKNLLLQNLLKTNLKLLKSMDLSNTVLF